MRDGRNGQEPERIKSNRKEEDRSTAIQQPPSPTKDHRMSALP